MGGGSGSGEVRERQSATLVGLHLGIVQKTSVHLAKYAQKSMLHVLS